LIKIKVIDTPLDYNILLGCSYMYAMEEVSSYVFDTMIFPHNKKVIMVDQLTHYEPRPNMNLDNILPLIREQIEHSPFMEMDLNIFQDPSLLGTY